MLLYLVSHGESEANVGGYINEDPARPVLLAGEVETVQQNGMRPVRAVSPVW